MIEDELKIKKHNMKLYPKYLMFGFDLLFFYGVRVLFYTEVKGMTDSQILLSVTIYAISMLLAQIPATMLTSRIGYRNTAVLGNILNIIWAIIIIFFKTFLGLAISQVISGLAFTLKFLSESNLLTVSIPSEAQYSRNEIFTRIDRKGYSRYCILSAVSTILSGFLYSYFLPFTPSIISCLPFVILAAYLSSKKLTAIYNVAFVLLFLSLFIIILKTTLLTNEFHYSNLFPILSVKTTSVFKASLIYAVISTSPLLILLNENIEFKASLKYYLLAALTNIIVGLTITLILGELINVYSYPEYTILRRIKFFKFIENIENFICINWFFDLFISLTLFITKIKDTLNIKNNIVPFLVSLSILYIVNKYFANNFYNTMFLYKFFPYICGGFIIVLLVLASIKKLYKSKA